MIGLIKLLNVLTKIKTVWVVQAILHVVKAILVLFAKYAIYNNNTGKTNEIIIKIFNVVNVKMCGIIQ